MRLKNASALMCFGLALAGVSSCENRLDTLGTNRQIGQDSDDGETLVPRLRPAPDAVLPVSFAEECSNQQLDGSETGPDCGGADCAPCGLGLPCNDSSDCESGECSAVDPTRPLCIPASCVNGEVDEDETAEDCGGRCPGCPDDAECTVAADCASSICSADGTCAAPRCDDGVKNGSEGGPDCGGQESSCELCDDGVVCDANTDCASTLCWAGFCAPLSCDDGAQSGNETDTDCGGSCPPCASGDGCAADGDCMSGLCRVDASEDLVCQAAGCDDDVRNGDEAGIDCGGRCGQACPAGTPCTLAVDCADNVCLQTEDDETTICRAAACDDDVRNGAESAIDCGGGDCDPCPAEAQCNTDADCSNGPCITGACARVGAGETCGNDGDCLSDACQDNSCTVSDAAQACRVNADCLGNACLEGWCQPASAGQLCTQALGCLSGLCAAGRCAIGAVMASCQAATDCASGVCAASQCQPLGLGLESFGGAASGQTVEVEFFLSAGANPIRYDELAVLYFFTSEFDDDALARNFDLNAPDVPTTKTYVRASGNDWVYVWRSSSPDLVVSHRGYHQLNHITWTAFDRTNDYSYLAVRAANPAIVVCRNVGGSWGLAQGAPPQAFGNPCQWVTSCEGVTCVMPQ